MGGFILINKSNSNQSKIYVLNAYNCLNFNIVSNQIYAQKINIPYELLIQRERIKIILQWYIYVRNFGCVFYNNKIYNLNLSYEAIALLKVLESEHFLKFLDDKTVTVIDPMFSYIGTIQISFLWVNLIHKKLTELNDEQIKQYNTSILKSTLKGDLNNVL